MGQITDTGRYIPLIEYFENCNTLLRASLRALVAMKDIADGEKFPLRNGMEILFDASNRYKIVIK